MIPTASHINYTIIIPHKNTPDLLRRCLNSIPQRRDLEVIVVDNNSSPEIVDFEHFPGSERKDVLILRDNNSISGGGARNTGLAYANGKWVLFADADDYYTEGFLQTLDKYKEQNIDVVYYNFNRIKDEKITELPISLQYIKSAYEDPKDAEFLRFRYAVPWIKMINRSFLEDYHVLFEDCVVANDLFFSYQVGYYAKYIKVEPAKLYNYVINLDSISTKRRNTTDYYLCSFRHYYQNKEFHRFVNHPEWEPPIIKRFIWILCRKGLRQFMLAVRVYLRNYTEIKRSKYYFVDQIKNEIRNHHAS